MSQVSLRSRQAVAILILSGLLTGCASTRGKAMSKNQSARANREDASFAAGTHRPPTPQTSFALARILIARGRDRDALYVLQRVLRDNPKFIPAYNEIAGIYVRSDRVDDAMGIVSAGLTRAPDDTVLCNNLGMCHFIKGDYQRALEAYTRATQRSPSNPLYRANRAAALAMLGHDLEAQCEYRSVLDRETTRQNLEVLSDARKAQAAASIGETRGVQEIAAARGTRPASTQPAADVQ